MALHQHSFQIIDIKDIVLSAEVAVYLDWFVVIDHFLNILLSNAHHSPVYPVTGAVAVVSGRNLLHNMEVIALKKLFHHGLRSYTLI